MKTETNSVFFFWEGGRGRGLKVSDRKIKESTSSKFTLLVCLAQDPHGRSLLLSVRTQLKKKVILWTRVGGKYECACLYMWYCVCGFCIGTEVWFLTIMMWSLHKLTDRKGKERKTRGMGDKPKMRVTKCEREFVFWWSNSGQKQTLDYLLTLSSFLS